MVVHRFISPYKYAQERIFDANCALMGYYAARSGNSLRTFRDNIPVPFFPLEDRTDKLSRNVGKTLTLLAV